MPVYIACGVDERLYYACAVVVIIIVVCGMELTLRSSSDDGGISGSDGGGGGIELPCLGVCPGFANAPTSDDDGFRLINDPAPVGATGS